MPYCGRLEIEITTSTKEEFDRIAEAIYSGYAEHLLKENVLWESYRAPQSPAPQVPLPQASTRTGSVKFETGPGGEIQTTVKSSSPLKRIDTTVSEVPVVKQKEKKERPAGILGRGRMGRSST